MNSNSFPGEKPWERGLYEFITRELTQHDGTGNENGITTLHVVVLPGYLPFEIRKISTNDGQAVHE